MAPKLRAEEEEFELGRRTLDDAHDALSLGGKG